MARIDDRRNRLVPKIEAPAPMVVKDKALSKHVAKASDKTMQVYDCRRSYSMWCLEAGIPFDRVQAYMGHSAKSMTERYARSTMEQWLKDDGEKLTAYIAKHATLTVNPNINKFFEFEDASPAKKPKKSTQTA